MKAKLIIMCLVVGVLAPGCASYMRESRQAEAREARERMNVASDVNMLKERITGVERAQEQLSESIMEIQAQLEKLSAADSTLGSKLNQSIKALEARDEEIRRATIDSVSKQVAALIRSPSPEAAATSYGTGVEHTVESGQTLSAIAQAYGVTVSAIVKANNITNPNSVRAGQKLFIPR